MSRDDGVTARSSRDERVARAARPAEESLRLHALCRGKIQMLPKCPVRGFEDFALWYTPGVAAASRAIVDDSEAAWVHTNRANTVAIVTDGTRVLGLGDIGPTAALPVMEGKALLFKYLGGVDAVPICLATRDPDELVRIVTQLAPTFGAVNLEDIAQPKCFRVLDTLRATLDIPVWHDDQQGSATALLAGLRNAARIVGKDLAHLRIAMVGMGAANVAGYRLLTANGVDPGAIVACDRKGTLHKGRDDIARLQETFPDKWRVCRESNAAGVVGGIREALRGADACVAFAAAGPGIIDPAWVRGMARDAIVFACANPTPEIWPWDAKEAGARIVATGRSDFPNQLNNSLVFPGLFRGALDVRARTITDGMAGAVAGELARFAEARGISADDILPRMDEWDVHVCVALAAARAAQAEGVARVATSGAELEREARRRMESAREATRVLMRAGLIPGATAVSERA
jgi:malate dehydrogenase (oxaloacetate-decarboxylating)